MIRNVKIITVGNVKDKNLIKVIDEYTKMLTKFCKLNIHEVKEGLSSLTIDKIINDEGQKIDNILKNNSQAYIVSMCIEGKKFTSENFAKIFEEKAMNFSQIIFIIGGSYGIDEIVKNKSHLKISFSDLTFPHQMFKLILIEQIYRAYKILNNEKYHK